MGVIFALDTSQTNTTHLSTSSHRAGLQRPQTYGNKRMIKAHLEISAVWHSKKPTQIHKHLLSNTAYKPVKFPSYLRLTHVTFAVNSKHSRVCESSPKAKPVSTTGPENKTFFHPSGNGLMDDVENSKCW